jgi:signal peptidase II
MRDRVQIHTSPFRSPAALACFLLVAAIGLAADLWTKAAAWDLLVDSVEVVQPSGDILLFRNNLAAGGGEPVYDLVVVHRGLELTAVANQGAAMGLGQGRKTLFILVSIAAVGVLFYFFAHSNGRRLYQVVLGLLLAGVLGNLYDRLVHGYVRDMIHIFPGVRWTELLSRLPDAELFPWVFNLADIFLCVGVPAVLLYGLFAGGEEAEPEEEPGETT